LFGVSKQAYYQYDEDAAIAKAAREDFALQFIKQIRTQDPGIGGIKMWHLYQTEFQGNEPIGRDRFCRIVYENGFKIRQKIRKPKTTDSTHGLPTYPNLVKDFIPDAANKLWVSDITYIMIMDDETHYHFCYLSIVLDAYSEEIVGWYVSPTLDTEGPLKALLMALKRIEGKDVDLIHHSDRGVQYVSNDYVKVLKNRNIRISMTESGDPKDNAQAERINNTVKNELLHGMIFHDIADVISAVAVAVDFYNNRRPHMSIGMLTPAKASELQGDRDMKWKSKRHEAIKSKINLENSAEKNNFVSEIS
jgi:transposase InsO family protein